MENIGVTSLIKLYHVFDKEFWLGYKTILKLLTPLRFEEVKLSLLRSKRIDSKIIKEVGEETYKIEKDLLDLEWKEKNEEAKQTGTITHEKIHNMFCTNLSDVKTQLLIPTDQYRVLLTENFLNSEDGLFPEMKLSMQLDDNYTLVGIADLVIKKGNKITIIDWKTNDTIKFRSIYEVGRKKNKRLKFPLCAYEDCDGILYLIQLSLYALMIESLNPEFQIDNLYIIQLKDCKKYKEFNVEYLKQDMLKLLKWHVKNLYMKKEMEKCNLIKY